MVKNLPAMLETQFQPLGGEYPLEREWLPTPVFLPGEFHGQRSLVGYSPVHKRVRHDLGTIVIFQWGGYFKTHGLVSIIRLFCECPYMHSLVTVLLQ